MTQELFTMTQKELSRHAVIENLIDNKLNGTEAAKQLNLSVRQVRRIKNAVKQYGSTGIIHGNRGRESNRKISDKKIDDIEKIMRQKYYDFGPKFAAEKLQEIHKIQISGEKLRQMMIEWKLWRQKLRKENKKYHCWRERKDNYGEMQQFDGSYFVWFGAEESCLLLSVDDATGKITHAKFDYNEGRISVFKFWLEYIDENDIPSSIYLDKFSTYKVNHKNAVDNEDMITQFQRAANQAGIKLITANSPQAKGRVERMNKTLQDRLVKELRLAGITTIDKANEFLQEYIPKFNAQFAVVPHRKANLHKTVSQLLKDKLPQIFSIQNIRKVYNDYTVRFENQYFQLNKEQPITVYKKDSVIVEQHINGEIKINFKGHYLNYVLLPERPEKIINVRLPALTRRKQSHYKPPADHPWRKQFLFGDKLKNRQLVSV